MDATRGDWESGARRGDDWRGACKGKPGKGTSGRGKWLGGDGMAGKKLTKSGWEWLVKGVVGGGNGKVGWEGLGSVAD